MRFFKYYSTKANYSETLYQNSSPTGSGFPGLPAAFHAAKMKSTTSSTPISLRTLVNSVGPPPRISLESRSIISSDAPTCGAKSI